MKTPRHFIARRAAGFTLVELMAVLAIASILMGAGLPAFTNFLRSAKLTTATNDLFGALLLARGEAIKRNSRAVACKSTDGVTCSTAGGWEQGWIVFHDANNNAEHDAGEEVISRVDAFPADIHLSGNLNVARYVSYSGTGESKLVSGGFQAGTITLCHPSLRNGEGRTIVINSTGRPRIQKAAVAACA